jgi:hypothetical protein
MSHAIKNGVQLVLNNCNNFQLHMLFATKNQLQNINFLLVIMLDHKVGIIFWFDQKYFVEPHFRICLSHVQCI